MLSIQVKNVSKIFRIVKNENDEKVFGRFWGRKYIEKKAVNDISFQINDGEIVGYLGLNGAGKSTTIKMLTGIIMPTDGEILINGKVPGRDRKLINREIAVVFGQKSQLWWDLPVRDSLKIAKEMYRLDEDTYTCNYTFLNSMLDIDGIIENKTVEFLNFIRDELIVKICNILLQNSVALEDILSTPSYYGQPEILLLLLCKNNHDEGLLPAIEQDKRFINSSNIDKKIWRLNKAVIWGKP